MSSRQGLLLATLVVLTAAAPAWAESPAGGIRIPVERLTLPNGLEVILFPNRTMPEAQSTSGTTWVPETTRRAAPASRICAST